MDIDIHILKTKIMAKNKKMNQIGGDHYSKFVKPPIEFILDFNLDFIQGNIVKYVLRHKFKNGKQDLEKALSYSKLGEEKKLNKVRNLGEITESKIGNYCRINNITDLNIYYILFYTVCNKYNRVSPIIEDLIINYKTK